MKIKIFLVVFLVFFFFPKCVLALEDVSIYFFHSNTCSHCKEEEKVLKLLEEKYSNITIYRYEIHDEETELLFNKALDIYHFSPYSVPVTIIGNTVYTGFQSEVSSVKFLKTIEYYSKYFVPDFLSDDVDMSSYEKSDIPSLKKFMKTYRNYSLIGYDTDDLDSSFIAILLGILSFVCSFDIVVYIFLLVLLKYLNDDKQKILMFGFYFIFLFLLKVAEVGNFLWLYIILLLLGIGCILVKRNFLYFSLVLLLGIDFLFHRSFFQQYVFILNDIVSLRLMSFLEKINYYGNFFLVFLFIPFIISVMCLFVRKRLFN